MLDPLARSPYFLPRWQARRSLAEAYVGLGDDTLAILELQFFLLDLLPEADGDRHWAQYQLKKIRAREHPGPLHHSEESMQSISRSLSGLEVGSETQAKEQRVEEILIKVAKLLERMGGA